jgi:hypothetical protein
VSDPIGTVAERLRTAHREVLAGVVAAAATVADGWDGDRTNERDSVVVPLRTALGEAGLIERFPDVLADCVRAIDREPPAEIVPRPPYVAITSVGPVLRATLADGRLVATLRAFVVDRDDGVAYRRGPTDPAEVPEVQFA